jgi:hypothetical protein
LADVLRAIRLQPIGQQHHLFEHATIVDRVTAGLERRVREGTWMSGRTP